MGAEFDAARVPYVVVDQKQEIEEQLGPRDIPYIVGDITSDDNLVEAGIKSARGLIAAADSDVANLYVTLSARVLNPSLYIVARASEIESENKLMMAGANRVIAPYFISGKRMAALATRPVTSDFLDMVMHGESLEFSLNEVTIPDNSPLINKTISEAEIRHKSGALVLAIRRADGSFDLQPDSSSIIEKGDTFVVIGTQEQAVELRQDAALTINGRQKMSTHNDNPLSRKEFLRKSSRGLLALTLLGKIPLSLLPARTSIR